MNTHGYIYCLTNVSMPGLYVLDSSIRNPKEIVDEINNNVNKYKPPTPYVLRSYIGLSNVTIKKNKLYKILNNNNINGTTFFRVSYPKIAEILDLLSDGNIENIDTPLFENSTDLCIMDLFYKSFVFTDSENDVVLSSVLQKWLIINNVTMSPKKLSNVLKKYCIDKIGSPCFSKIVWRDGKAQRGLCRIKPIS